MSRRQERLVCGRAARDPAAAAAADPGTLLTETRTTRLAGRRGSHARVTYLDHHRDHGHRIRREADARLVQAVLYVHQMHLRQ
jgi:hypothetical protein